MITYATDRPLNITQFIDILKASTLGERRPIEDQRRMELMLANANLLVTAWEDDTPVGVARSFSDFAYVTYCSDLAVRVSHQKRGIGKELLRRTLAAGGCRIVLLAAPKAVDYYPHLGFTRHNSAWLIEVGQL